MPKKPSAEEATTPKPKQTPATKTSKAKKIAIFLVLAILFVAIFMHKLNRPEAMPTSKAPTSKIVTETAKPVVSHTETEKGELLPTTIIDVKPNTTESASITVLPPQPKPVAEKIIEVTPQVQSMPAHVEETPKEIIKTKPSKPKNPASSIQHPAPTPQPQEVSFPKWWQKTIGKFVKVTKIEPANQGN